MSKVAISGNASGTGTFTIQAPNSNTDRVLSLPDEAGTVLTSASSIPSSQITGSLGITEIDQWRISADHTLNDSILSSNWERDDTAFNSDYTGSGMSVSSGVWTFPVTGKWLMLIQMRVVSPSSSGANKYTYLVAECTTDGGSTFGERFNLAQGTYDNESYGQASGAFVFDVPDTSTHKFKLIGGSENNNVLAQGSTSSQRTGLTFIRLGDT